MNLKSKLKKIALMPEQMFESTLDQVSDKGRAILKAIEDYKFNLDQTMRVVKNDQALTNIIQQKKKNLDHAAQDLYNIVFEIENIDISAAYNEQQQSTEENGEKKEEQTPQDNQSQQGQPQGNPNDNETTPTGGGNATPSTPSSEPKEDGEQKEDTENKDVEENPEGEQSKDDSKPTPEKPKEKEKEEEKK